MIKMQGIKIATTVLSLSLMANVFAADDKTMTRDEWLGKLKEAVPSMICKNFTENEGINKQLIAANIDFNKCVSLIPASVDKCQTQFYSSIPQTIDATAAQTWGSTMGKCIGMDFVSTQLPVTAPTTTSSETNTDSQGQTMTKDEWLAKLKSAVPDLICKGFLEDADLGKRLTKLEINFEKCVTLIPESVDLCQKQFYDTLPATIDKDSANKWGHSMGECIGKDFAIKHLINDVSKTTTSPEATTSTTTTTAPATAQ